MSLARQHMHADIAGQPLRMARGNDLIEFAPDHQRARRETVDAVAIAALLGAIPERRRRDLLQALAHAFEPLVLDDVLDKLPRDERAVGEQFRQMRLQRIAAVAMHESVDVLAVDLVTETRTR